METIQEVEPKGPTVVLERDCMIVGISCFNREKSKVRESEEVEKEAEQVRFICNIYLIISVFNLH